MYASECVCVWERERVWVCVCVRGYLLRFKHIFIYMPQLRALTHWARPRFALNIHIYMYIYVCIHIYIYIYCTYICIYMYIYVYTYVCGYSLRFSLWRRSTWFFRVLSLRRYSSASSTVACIIVCVCVCVCVCACLRHIISQQFDKAFARAITNRLQIHASDMTYIHINTYTSITNTFTCINVYIYTYTLPHLCWS